MSGSWSDSEYISSYSFILARGIRSICMITPEILLPVMWACRSRHRVQIDVQLQAPMMSWHCWLLFIYKWVNALIYIYMVTHTHMCMHACMQASVIVCILVVFEGQQYMEAMGDRRCTSQELVLLTPGIDSASLTSRRGWMTFASCGNYLFLLPLILTTSTDTNIGIILLPTEETNARLLFSLGYSKCLRDRKKERTWVELDWNRKRQPRQKSRCKHSHSICRCAECHNISAWVRESIFVICLWGWEGGIPNTFMAWS